MQPKSYNGLNYRLRVKARFVMTAFTLIEMLVVISIISLLLSILLPVLNRAKSIASQTICKNHLRQWGYAFELYAIENNSFYPHIDGRDRCGDKEPITPMGKADYYYGWIDLLPLLIDEKPWREHERWHYPQKKTIFQCPSAKLSGPYEYNPLRNGYFSYAMNSCLELDGNCWPPCYPNTPCGRNDMPSFLKTTKIKRPANLVLLFEQLLDPSKGYGGKKENRTAGKHCGSYPKAFSARHARSDNTLGGNILYCDYHVDWVETVWKDEWPDDLEVPPRSDLDWFPY